jgi:geranylgeranyl pyrophosphate synthase
MAFQLVDDVLDYSGEHSGKTILADLAEGKLTLPLVLAVQDKPELAVSLQQIHAGDRELVEIVGQAVVASGACEIVRQRAHEQTQKAIEMLAPVPPTPALRLLVEVANQLAARMT